MGDSQVIIDGESSFERWPIASAPQGSAQPNAAAADFAERQAAERRVARRAQAPHLAGPDDQTRIDLPALSQFDDAPKSPPDIAPNVQSAATPEWPVRAPQPPAAIPPAEPAAPLTHAPWTVASSWGASSLNTPNTLAGFSYVLWWVTGLLVYFNERHNRYVRFHAVQSILLTGLLTVVSVLLYILSELSGDVAVATHQPAFAHLGQGIALLGYLLVIAIWLGAMIAAWSGHHLRLPIVGAYADRYSAPPREPFPPSPFGD